MLVDLPAAQKENRHPGYTRAAVSTDGSGGPLRELDTGSCHPAGGQARGVVPQLHSGILPCDRAIWVLGLGLVPQLPQEYVSRRTRSPLKISRCLVGQDHVRAETCLGGAPVISGELPLGDGVAGTRLRHKADLMYRVPRVRGWGPLHRTLAYSSGADFTSGPLPENLLVEMGIRT
jgi:hypothetical protein